MARRSFAHRMCTLDPARAFSRATGASRRMTHSGVQQETWGRGDVIAMLATKLKLIQAPMAGVSTPKLAAAVTNAGAIGSLGVAGQPLAKLRDTIQQTQALTTGPINVNFFCFNCPAPNPAANRAWIDFLQPLFATAGVEKPADLKPVYASFDGEMLDLMLELRPQILSFHFGFPELDHIRQLKAAGIELWGTATCIEEAAALESAGIDAIVAQGIEAGGHRGTFDPLATHDERMSTLELVAELQPLTMLPIIAAGGIMDGNDIEVAVRAGARAVQLGTAFISCPESAASAQYRANLNMASTTLLHSTVSGRYARGIPNAFTKFALGDEAPAPAPFPYAYDAQKQLAAASPMYVNQWAGTGAVKSLNLPAAQLVEHLLRYL